MSYFSESPASPFQWLVTLVLALAMAGCATVKLVGYYDEQIDKGVTQLQKDTETFLVKLESSAKGQKDNVEDYANNIKFYENSKVALSGLRVRADAMERNSITVRMLDGLSNNIFRLEAMHQNGLLKAEIEDIRGALNSQFTAILTFELAKKRGEKVDDGKLQTPSTPKATIQGVNK